MNETSWADRGEGREPLDEKNDPMACNARGARGLWSAWSPRVCLRPDRNEPEMNPTLSVLPILVLAAATAAQTAIYRDATSSEHRTQARVLTRQGYRPVSLTVHGAAADPRYTAAWRVGGGPPFIDFHDQNVAQYLSTVKNAKVQGYRLALLSVTGKTGNPLFAGVLVQDKEPVQVVHDADATAFDAACEVARDSGLILTSGREYGSRSAPLFAAVFTPNTSGAAWTYGRGESATELQRRHGALAGAWMRPSFVSSSEFGTFLSVWSDDQVGPFNLHHELTAAELDNLEKGYALTGVYAEVLQGRGVGSSGRYTAVFVQNHLASTRQWSVTGAPQPSMASLDAWVRTFMQANGIRAGQLAVAKDCELVFAHGYTLAEPGYPITQPVNGFRIASVAKPITAIAIHREMELGLGLTDGVAAQMGYTQSQLNNPTFWYTTVDHLLTHTGGWANVLLGFDPMFADVLVANARSNGSLPVNTNMIRGYMLSPSSPPWLMYVPGSASSYSNFGFSLLGRVLEARNPGFTYEALLQAGIMTPLGLTRPFIGGTAQSAAVPGEVRYEPREPALVTTILDNSGDVVPIQYGGFHVGNFDAHGGWVAAAPDLVRILASFDLGAQNPILTPASAQTMWTVPAPSLSSTQARGWIRAFVPGASGAYVAAMWHNGSIPGSAALAFRRTDNVSFALLFNRDVTPVLGAFPHGSQINDLLNAVTTWPSSDLFPSVGIPSFKEPSLGAPLNPVWANVSLLPATFQGSNLLQVTSVAFGGKVIKSQSPSSVAEGYFVPRSNTLIDIYPPQGWPPGTYDVSVQGSASVPLSVVATATPSLVGASAVTAGQPYDLFAAKGTALSTKTSGLLTLSLDPIPSVAPGLVSLGIGNQFRTLLSWLPTMATNPVSGAARWSLPSVAAMRGATLHFQVVLVDPGRPLPLPTTNPHALTFQ